jgi:hypothetical protein
LNAAITVHENLNLAVFFAPPSGGCAPPEKRSIVTSARPAQLPAIEKRQPDDENVRPQNLTSTPILPQAE